MKIPLDQLEARLQALIEGSAARLFSFGKRGDDLSVRLVKVMRANIHTQGNGSLMAPNLYTIVCTPVQAKVLSADQELLHELAGLLFQAGTEAGLQFPSSPFIKVLSDDQLTYGGYEILAHFNLEGLAETSTMELRPGGEHHSASPRNAFFIVDGLRTVPLLEALINIGRSQTNHLVIDDPRVSRHHAQVRAIHHRYVIFDLGSTGGTFINTKRIEQGTLYPGDVVSLSGVPLIYGEDSDRSAGHTQPLVPSTGGSE